MNERQQIREAIRNMPKGKPTPAEVQADVYDAVVNQGVPMKQVARDMGMHPQTVSNIIKRYKLAEEHEREREQRVTEKVLAGDKENGRLISTAPDIYEGTCKRANGKMAKKVFRATGLRAAQGQWERWCAGIRDEDAKAASVERAHRELVETPSCKDVSDRLPIRSGMMPADVAAMLRAEIDAESVSMDAVSWECLLSYIEGLELPNGEGATEDATTIVDITRSVNAVCESDISLYALSELRSGYDVMVTRDAWNRLADKALDLATQRADGLPEEMYVTWMADKGPHALFSDMETATRTVDTLNSALEFAGIEKRYEVMDVKPWRD